MDGVWSEWGAWSNCSSDCLKNRTRECDNPAPMNNGSSCSGNYTEIADCKVTNCAGIMVFIVEDETTQIFLLVDLNVCEHCDLSYRNASKKRPRRNKLINSFFSGEGRGVFFWRDA